MGLAYAVIEEISERVTADMEGRTEANNSIFNKIKINWFRVVTFQCSFSIHENTEEC